MLRARRIASSRRRAISDSSVGRCVMVELSLLDVPFIDEARIPQDERHCVYNCRTNMFLMQSFWKDFHNALFLRKFARNHAAMWKPSPVKTMEDMFISWEFIAARDGAMSIYHFFNAMDAVNTWAHKSKSIADNLDRDALKNAFKIKKQHFPRFEAMRHAVSHAGELQKNQKRIDDNFYSGSYDGSIKIVADPGTGNGAIYNSLFGDNYVSMINNEIIEYKINDETLDILSTIAKIYFGAFAPLAPRAP